ncbi:hypothetical protein Syun_006449 [Stephania yunnanensis]|uniref:Uncharacterized protein n=1 Tax=Stephania yunnanensis TaxID=152371 RepID=A0AAP0KWL5_9MAGN
MENGQACSCFNGTQDEEGANYSAPVPVIGLYIAGATLVCLSLIVGDLVNAFRSRLFWVPCRFFTMNSFTLTVVGVVTKIPVDLTTPMPDGQDQLAKIYGTSLLFIFMVLFIPSVGKMTASERIPNLASLTLIVITVIVNICMQIGTGLIFKFVVEHVVIMVLMLLTLCIMWSPNADIDTWLDANIDGTKDFVKYCQSRDDQPGLDQDMKLVLLGKLNVPELLSCKFGHYPTMGILCATCFIVSSEATFDEVFDVLYFIGENPAVTKDYVHDDMMWIGRDYWMRRKTGNHYFQRCSTRWRSKLNYHLGRILRTEGTSSFQRKTSIVDVLHIQENETLDAQYRSIEEIFLCLLHRFLNRLPDVIFKYIVESSNQDFLERATTCLKFLCRLNLIDARVQWSETNIISFITREATGVPSQVDVVAGPYGATALLLDHIIEVASGESGRQTQTITDDYGSEIAHRIAAGILALFNASYLTIGIPGEEQGNQTIILSDDNNRVIIAASIARLINIIAPPLTTGVTGDEQGSQTFISMETFNDDYNRGVVFGVAARLAALILHLPLAIALASDEEQGSQAFITRETLTDDYMREFALRIAHGIGALITASPSTVGVTDEDEQGSGSRDFITRGIDVARVAAHIASLIIAFPLTIELPGVEGQGSQTLVITREKLTPEKVLHVLFIKLLSNSCWTSSRVGDEMANDVRRHVFQLMQDYSSQLQSSRSQRGTY